MPTYEYRCNSCSHEFELFQSMSDSPKRKCPSCGKSTLERLIGTGAAIVFKGSGFYQTDYRSESYRKAADADSKSVSPEKPDSSAKPADGTSSPSPSAPPSATPDSSHAGSKQAAPRDSATPRTKDKGSAPSTPAPSPAKSAKPKPRP